MADLTCTHQQTRGARRFAARLAHTDTRCIYKALVILMVIYTFSFLYFIVLCSFVHDTNGVIFD